MKRFGMLGALVFLALTGSAQANAQATRWNHYANPRFAFSVCYPDWLQPGREPDNGDGRVFTDKSGVEMAVWGSYAHMILTNGREEVSDGAPAMALAQGADFDAASLSHITYKAVRDRWYVVSGTSNGQIVYFKTLAAGDRWISLRLSYPATAAAKWNPLARRIGACLKALQPAL